MCKYKGEKNAIHESTCVKLQCTSSIIFSVRILETAAIFYRVSHKYRPTFSNTRERQMPKCQKIRYTVQIICYLKSYPLDCKKCILKVILFVKMLNLLFQATILLYYIFFNFTISGFHHLLDHTNHTTILHLDIQGQHFTILTTNKKVFHHSCDIYFEIHNESHHHYVFPNHLSN